MNGKEKLFLFEFATCGERIEDSIAVEGLAMFRTLYSGFKNFLQIHSFVREEFSNNLKLPAGSMNELERWLEESDYFLIIAPEDDWSLLNLTKIGERHSINLGCTSKAIEVTSDKWRLYKKLKAKVNMPRTSKKPLNEKFVVKPRISCGGEGVSVSQHGSVPDGFIAQEYVDGSPLSVSFVVGDDINAVSINEQLLNDFKYSGSVLPARISPEVALDVINEAAKTVECVSGLQGYVGVDVVYADQPYVIEVNARPTTSIVGFEIAYGVNVAEMIWKAFKGEDFELRTVRRCRIFKTKYCEDVTATLAKVGDYSVLIEKVEF